MADSIGKQFIDYYQSQRVRALIGIDDWADRLSYFYSVIILSLCVTIVTVKTYFLNPLACHCPTNPAGSKFGPFLTETCFTLGTVPIRPNESLPQTDIDWHTMSLDRRKNYYYWVPFMLGVQLILFYLPDLAWRSLTYNKLGTNLNTLIQESISARSTTSVSQRRSLTSHVAESLRLVLFDHRNVENSFLSDVKQVIGRFCGVLLASKRLGTWTIASYFVIKLMYLANSIGQLFLMRHFLGFDKTDISNFGIELASRLKMRDDWKQSLYFPRSAFCRVNIRLLGSENSYVAICALPVNLFNEKIYMFLWFWVAFVFICTVISFPMWFMHLGFESRRIKRLYRYFCIDQLEFDELDEDCNPFKKSPHNKEHMKQFIEEFLRYDGLFIIEIVDNHVGDLVTGEIVRLLWTSWVKEYADRHDFRQDDWVIKEKEAVFDNYTPASSISRYPQLTPTSPFQNRAPSSVKSGHV